MSLQADIKTVCVRLGQWILSIDAAPVFHNSGMYGCSGEKYWKKPSKGFFHVTGPFLAAIGPGARSRHQSSSESMMTLEVEQFSLMWFFSPSRKHIVLTFTSSTVGMPVSTWSPASLFGSYETPLGLSSHFWEEHSTSVATVWIKLVHM